MKTSYYTIKDVAKRTGMSPHTIRFYDKKGLLTFVKRSESGIRLFVEEDFESLYTIHCLKESGMSLAKIKEFMDLFAQGNKTIEARGEMFQLHKKDVINQIEKLQEMLEIIEYKCWFFEEAKKHNDVYFYKKMNPSDYPEEIKNFLNHVHDFQNFNK